ncbi:GNAT family N-acetyltransferase [Hydrocarboniphaga effusa]|jgi:GNAT superfamily N-acetyltransferase|uniref:GNAT family N-acetyltransferase n=1 Tax=Hydrocarboniphaga effusa TaxID=243629 RepID=UPI003137A120
MSGPAALTIAPATAHDVPLILALIRELADYEQLSDQVSATEAALRASLFGERPAAEVLVARSGGEPAGFALFFPNYSTFLAKPGIYLEDLFVRPAFRGQGIGKALLASVAALAVARGCGRFEWSVLDWNDPAIGFYRRLGARPLDDWTMFRITGAELAALAAGAARNGS